MKPKMRVDKKFFLAQNRATRRVMLAQDCIDAVNAGRMIAKTGTYVGVIERDRSTNIGLALSAKQAHVKGVSETDVCHALLDPDQACVVCARGGLIAARIGYQHPADEDCDKNQIFKGKNLFVPDDAVLASAKDFTQRQAALMECAFERCDDLNHNFLSLDLRCAARRYGFSLSDIASERFTQIMQNVIDHNGTFVIPKEFYSGDD